MGNGVSTLASLVVLSLAALWLAATWGGFTPWLIFYIFAGLALEGAAWNSLALRRMVVSRRLSSRRLAQGASVQIELVLRQEGWWPLFWVVVEEDQPPTLGPEKTKSRFVLFPGLKRNQVLTYSSSDLPRGVHCWGRVKVSAWDIFNFVQVLRDYSLSDKLLVHPQPAARARLPKQVAANSRENSLVSFWRRLVQEEDAGYRGLRDYRPGDRWHQVHWRVSAHAGELKSRDTGSTVPPVILLLLDCRPESYSTVDDPLGRAGFEQAVRVCAALILKAVAQRHPVTLYAWPDTRLQTPPSSLTPRRPGSQTPLAAEAWLDFLAEVDLADAGSLKGPFPGGRLPWGASLLWLTGTGPTARHLPTWAASISSYSSTPVSPTILTVPPEPAGHTG